MDGSGERFDVGLWAGHVALALALGPLFLLMDTLPYELFWWGVVGVYVAAPFAGYRWMLRGIQGPPLEAGPCQRTGTAGSWHWFEWAERPGLRWWTKDDAIAAAIRERRQELPQQGVDLRLYPGPDPRAPFQLDRMVKNLTAVSGSMLLGFFSLIVWAAVSGVGTFAGIGEVLTASLVCLPVTLLPALIGVWVGYWGLFFALWSAWHRFVVPRRARVIRWNGPQVHSDQHTAYLDEPQVRVERRAVVRSTVRQGDDPIEVRGLDDQDDPLVRRLLDLRSSGPSVPAPEGRPVLSWTLTVHGQDWTADLYETDKGDVVLSDLRRQAVGLRSSQTEVLWSDPRLRPTPR